jgi:hypothetical protein
MKNRKIRQILSKLGIRVRREWTRSGEEGTI